MRAEHKGERRPSALPNFDDCLSVDRPRLRRMARDLSRPPRADERAAAQRLRLQADFDALLERSRAALLARRAALPVPDFPAELPVSARRDEIADLGGDFDRMVQKVQALVGSQRRLLHDRPVAVAAHDEADHRSAVGGGSVVGLPRASVRRRCRVVHARLTLESSRAGSRSRAPPARAARRGRRRTR